MSLVPEAIHICMSHLPKLWGSVSVSPAIPNFKFETGRSPNLTLCGRGAAVCFRIALADCREREEHQLGCSFSKKGSLTALWLECYACQSIVVLGWTLLQLTLNFIGKAWRVTDNSYTNHNVLFFKKCCHIAFRLEQITCQSSPWVDSHPHPTPALYNHLQESEFSCCVLSA